MPFPTTEWPVGELPAGVDRAAIDAAVDRAFGAPDAEARVRSIVVVSGGQIVYERYHPLDGPDVIYDSFSVAKSFTSALIGMLVADGKLALDENPPQPEWQAPGDPRQAITLRNLLQMSSGLQWTEEYGAGSLAAQMFISDDAAALMAAQPLESNRGRRSSTRPARQRCSSASPPTPSAVAPRRPTTSRPGCSNRSASRPPSSCPTGAAAGSAASGPT